VVLAREDVPGDKRLVAYVTTATEHVIDAHAFVATLRAHLSARLPDYMVPSAFVHLDALPLTPNGKLDRKALPAPDGEAYARGAYDPPQDEIGRILATLWEELLGVEQVSRHDNFFALGGHSLLAMQLLGRTSDLGLNITLNELFQNPVLQDLTSRITHSPQYLDCNQAIPIRKFGIDIPIFFVPTGVGDYSHAFALTKDIDASCPAYVLPWQPAQEIQVQTLEAMACRMVTMMKMVQPHGPYRLIGYSSGGVLTYAIAQQLLSVNESVAFIGLIDTHLPSSPRYATDEEILLDFAELDKIKKNTLETNLRSSAVHLSLLDLIKEAIRLGMLPYGYGADRWIQICHFLRMVSSYRATNLPLMVHMFCAAEGESAPEKQNSHDYESPGLTGEILDSQATKLELYKTRWAEVLPTSSIKLAIIPGDHVTMMLNPMNRLILGTSISDALKKIPCDLAPESRTRS
jgi:aryl carrier-like protein